MNFYTEILSEKLTETPLVSVVVCSYNRAKEIVQTLESILAQRCSFDFELIIGDDCSNDETRSLLEFYQQKHPDKIRLVFQNENIGVAANWATCVKLCKGKYIATCDDDDYGTATKNCNFKWIISSKHPIADLFIPIQNIKRAGEVSKPNHSQSKI